MKAALTLTVLLMAGTAHAAPSPSQAARAAAATPQRVPGVSDAGNAIIVKAQVTPDPKLNALATERRQLISQLVALAAAPRVDVDQVAVIMKRSGVVQAQMRALSDEHLIGAMRQLSDPDRTAFLRAILPPPGGAPR